MIGVFCSTDAEGNGLRNYIFEKVNQIMWKYDTRDPFELLDALGVVVKLSESYGAEGLKGYCYFSKRTIFVVVNSCLSDIEQRIVAMHEAAHVILHRDLIKVAPMKDFVIYDMTSRAEYEANLFAADYLISDEEVAELVESGDLDYFQMCSSLCIPAAFMAFKLFSLIQRGYNYNMPQNLDSGFLGR